MKRIAIAALVLLVLAGLTAAGGFLWWQRSLDDYAQAPFGSNEEKVVEIAQGMRMKEVSALLAKAGVVSDETRFYWLARRLKKDRAMKAGEYAFQGPMLPEKVLELIAQGKVRLYHCTIPEGLRADEIAPLLEKCGYGTAAEILKLVKDPAFIKKVGVTAASLEGYLYPDTYSFPRGPKTEAVLQKMVASYFEAYKRAKARQKPGVKLDAHQAATLASIVEKETGVPEERPRISCVFHNRLAKNMKLETDPTVIYAKILRFGSFDGNIKREDLEFQHPYNTYTIKGLPPGPIANAGAAAIEAALSPMDCDDLFFVACGGGTHQFCPDYDCHLRYVAKCQLGKH